MAINVDFYKFSKRSNSTKTPAGAPDTLAVNLKNGVDLISPSFLIAYEGYPDYNYLKFNGRYYFIDNITAVRNDLFEISCTDDYLGSWKSSILAMSAMVLYYTHNNTEICDKRLSTKTVPTVATNEATFDTFGGTPATSQAVVVSIVGRKCMGVFAMSQAAVTGLLGDALTDKILQSYTHIEEEHPYVTVTNVQTAIENIGIAFQRAWQNLNLSYNALTSEEVILNSIKSAIQVPLSVEDCGGYDTDILIGGIDTGSDGKLIVDRIFSDGTIVNIPWQGITDWRRNSPYMEIYLYLPGIGNINIPVNQIIGATSINVHVSMDKISGEAIFTADTDTGVRVYYGTSNLSTQYPIGASNVPPLNAISNIASGATAYASDNPMALTNSFIGVANSLMPIPTMIGSNSGGASQGLNLNKVYCTSILHDTTVAPSNISATKGTPYNAVMNLNGVAGYVQTLDFSIEGDMLKGEKEMINSLMDGGVYIE